MKKVIIADNLSRTREAASFLAEAIKKGKIKRFFNAVNGGAAVIALTGELGSGKTSFTQGFAEELGIKERLTSPTFVIQKKYKINPRKRIGYDYLIHIDAYRVKNPKEILDLGWEEMVFNPKNIIIVEWAERVKDILPQNRVQINFKHLRGDKRKIIIGKPESFHKKQSNNKADRGKNRKKHS